MMQALDSARANKPAGTLQAAFADADGAVLVSNPATIARILDDAASKRATLTIKLETAAKLYIYHSRIQGLDMAHSQMVLHKLMPANWVEHVTTEHEVEVSCQLPSGLLRFRSTLAPLEAETISPYCVLALPRELHKHQLRSSYRVVMPPGSSSLTLLHGGTTVHGHCLNLSLEGCGGMFRGELAELTRDVVVPQLSVRLDDTLHFTTAATVCRRHPMQNGSTQLGLRFDALDVEVQRKLQVSLTNLQRRQLRKQG